MRLFFFLYDHQEQVQGILTLLVGIACLIATFNRWYFIVPSIPLLIAGWEQIGVRSE